VQNPKYRRVPNVGLPEVGDACQSKITAVTFPNLFVCPIKQAAAGFSGFVLLQSQNCTDTGASCICKIPEVDLSIFGIWELGLG
jgi:hypothetical protein